MFFKIVWKGKDLKDKQFVAIMLAGIMGYFTISLFSFPLERVNHQIYLVLMMAGIISIYYQSFPLPIADKKRPLFNMNILSIFMAGLVIIYSIILFRSDIYAQKLKIAKEKKQWQKVIQYADKAHTLFTSMDSFSTSFHLNKGTALWMQGKTKEAHQEFLIAHNYFPTSISILNNLGAVSAKNGNYEQAISYFQKSLENIS